MYFVKNDYKAPDSHKTPLIIDTDMAADDLVAILYLAHSSEVAIQAITVSGTGFSHGRPGVCNLQRILRLAKASSIPIALGSERNLSGDMLTPTTIRDSVDKMYGLSAPCRGAHSFVQTADRLMADVITRADQKITLLALAPMTNIAKFLLSYPRLKHKIKRIVAMGGAVSVPGNLGHYVPTNTKAEWNFYLDTKAVSIVLSSGVPVTLIPLDVLAHVSINRELRQKLLPYRDASVAEFVWQILSKYHNKLWDPAAAVAVTKPSIFIFKDARFSISGEKKEDTPLGALLLDPKGSLVRYATGIDRDKFLFSLLVNLRK